MGLVLGGRARVVLTGHADASWVDNLATQRSSQGYTFSLGSGSVSWRSTRSSSVLSSSCEAEIYAGAMAAQELRWLTYLLADLGEAPRSPPVLYLAFLFLTGLVTSCSPPLCLWGGVASMKSAGNESESRDDRFPGQFFFVSTQASAGPEKDEGFEEPAAVGKVTLHSLDYWVIDSGTTYSMTPRADLLTELEPSPVKHVTSALGQRAEVKGMGKAMFKGADGKMLGLKNVLWVPNLAANLISMRRLQKAGMDTSSKGAKTYTARLGERILWDLHEDRDVFNEMWQIPVVPMPKEREVAASISTKGESVGSGDGTNGRAKEIESKKCNLGGTSKLGEHKESGAAAQKQHKYEDNPKAAAEEEYGENIS
ncbi:unnamed protein product [Closterium sp. NIES-53]